MKENSIFLIRMSLGSSTACVNCSWAKVSIGTFSGHVNEGIQSKKCCGWKSLFYTMLQVWMTLTKFARTALSLKIPY
jgi:hypothetical protein